MDPTPNLVSRDAAVARSHALGDLAQHVCAAYAAVQNLKPDGYNDHFNFAFVSIAQLSQAVRAALAAAGVVILPSVHSIEETAWKTGTRAVVAVDFLLVAAKSGEFVTLRQVGAATDRGDKAIAKAIAGATKEMLRRTFLIASALPSEDPDAGDERQEMRWNRLELDSEIEGLLAATDVGDERVEQFRSYLLDVYAVNAWSDVPITRLAAIRDRLRSLPTDGRREAILDKVRVADAA